MLKEFLEVGVSLGKLVVVFLRGPVGKIIETWKLQITHEGK